MASIPSVTIAEIQGTKPFSPLAEQRILTRGIVTGHSRRGFFIQDPNGSNDPRCSSGLFVYDRDANVKRGEHVEIEGIIADYLADEFDRPVTQLLARNIQHLKSTVDIKIEPVWLDAKILQKSNSELAKFLNAHEGMLMGIKAGAAFIAPSNPFADYVVLPEDCNEGFVRSNTGGMLINPDNPDQWLPGFRIVDYNQSIKLDVGSILGADLTGPLNYRAKSFQLAVSDSVKVEHVNNVGKTADSVNYTPQTSLLANKNSITVLTLNGFNLDQKIESAKLVQDPRRDIDDDLGDGRFDLIAKSIVEQASSPDVVALQEIQDSDGAEITDVVHAQATYYQLIKAIKSLKGPTYHWADIPPEAGADGGQPGGNIRNAYLYNPNRVSLVEGSLSLIAANHEAFEGSRKPLQASFLLKSRPEDPQAYSGLTIINVHLASKRHQRGIFAAEQAGHDERQIVRLKQVALIRKELSSMIDAGKDFYLTGDFNDCEFSETLIELLSNDCINLVETLEHEERYDYNHRGKLQSLMHGIVRAEQYNQNRAEYEILHGNELTGIKPGQFGGKASDHAYVIARLKSTT